MKKLPLLLLLTSLVSQAHAQTQLQSLPVRISDAAIQADHQAYEALQARIKGLNDAGRRVADYHLSKAQCWLDVSFHEYTRNDRGPFPQAAMTESEQLIVGMEKAQPLGMDTPLVGQAVKLRDDLWTRAQALKGHQGFNCATQKTACAEVELVHAGNEHAQQGWRHAKPYVQIAEDLLGEAEQQAAQCSPGLAPAVAAVQTAPFNKPMAVVVQEELNLNAEVVFAFDKDGEKDIRPASRATLDTLLARLRTEGWQVRSFQLAGHADRLNSTRKADYNQRLSERRVSTVSRLIEQAGYPTQLLATEARGDTRQVQPCAQVKPQAELRECLLPNRRVEIRLVAVREKR
jgi:OmpA-OmpF porin, OOP family